MKIRRYSFSAGFVLNRRVVQGTLEIDEQRMSFKTGTKHMIDRVGNWCNTEWKVGSELTTLVFVIKKEKKYLEIVAQGNIPEKFYIDAKDESIIIEALSTVKRNCQEEERKQQEELVAHM